MKSRRLWIAVLGVLLIAMLGLVFARREVARALLVGRVQALGLSGFSVDVISLGPSRASLANLRIDLGLERPALEVSEIELHYSAGSLLGGRIAQVDITGLRLSARLRDGEIDLGLDPGSSGSGGAIPRPFDALNLTDVEMILLTEDDALTLASELRSEVTPDGGVAFEIDLDFHAANSQLAARTRLRGHLAATGALDLSPIECIEIELPSSWFELPFHLTPRRPLCLRGETDKSLTIRDLFENPSDLDLALTLDPLEFKGRVGDGEDATHFEIEVPEVRVHYALQSPASNPELRLSAAGGRVELPDESLSIEALAIDLGVEFSPGNESNVPLPSGTFTLGRILDRATPPRFGPLTARGRIDGKGTKLRIGVDLADVAGLLRLRIDAIHAPDAGTGSLEFSLEPPVLEEIGDRLSRLFPVLAGEVSGASGGLALDGRLSWDSESLAAAMTLKLDDLGLTTSWGQLVGVASTVSLQGPAPFYMAQTQRMTIERVVAGVEIADCVVDFRLRRDGVIEIPLVRWSFAGGIAETSGLYDPRSERHEFSVKATGVDLQTLLDLLAIEGLSGEGTLVGEFPVVIDGDVIELHQARLSSTSAGGWLRYRPGGVSAAAAAQDDYLAQFTQLLENFHFESVVISLNGNVLGDVETAIHLKGANPDFQDGFPAELNLSVESKFWDLIRDGTAAFRLADRLADLMGRSFARDRQMGGERSSEKSPGEKR